jgi:hypothetical protein
VGERNDKNPEGAKTGVETGNSIRMGAGGSLVGVQALDHLLQQGGPPDVHAVAAIIRKYPHDRDPIVTRLHQTLGNSYVGRVVALVSSGPASTKPALGTDPINEPGAKGVVASGVVAAPIVSTSTSNASLDPELRGVESGLAIATTIRNTLLPPYRERDRSELADQGHVESSTTLRAARSQT